MAIPLETAMASNCLVRAKKSSRLYRFTHKTFRILKKRH